MTRGKHREANRPNRIAMGKPLTNPKTARGGVTARKFTPLSRRSVALKSSAVAATSESRLVCPSNPIRN